jgi:hypothetical protein
MKVGNAVDHLVKSFDTGLAVSTAKSIPQPYVNMFFRFSTFRVDTWTPDRESIVERIAASRTIRLHSPPTARRVNADCLRQDARVIEDSRRLRLAWASQR